MSGKTVTRVNRGTDAGEGVINLIAGIHLMDELENMTDELVYCVHKYQIVLIIRNCRTICNFKHVFGF